MPIYPRLFSPHILFETMAEDTSIKKKPVQWKESEAKFLLRDDIIGGIVTSDMTPKEVYKMRDCYSDYKYERFRSNLRSLRLAVKNGLERAEKDEEAFLHDMNLFGKQAEGKWHRSDAYKILKEDIKSGQLKDKKPKEVYNSRHEYHAFTLTKFRKQVYHEHDRIQKLQMIKDGAHPRFNRLKKHDPRKYKVKSSEVLPTKK